MTTTKQSVPSREYIIKATIESADAEVATQTSNGTIARLTRMISEDNLEGQVNRRRVLQNLQRIPVIVNTERKKGALVLQDGHA